MRLPKNLLDGTYGAPSVLLCETDKTPIAGIDVLHLNGTFKFNSYSEITFEFPRYYTNPISGAVITHPLYNKLEALRLVYLGNDFGYFEIQEPEINGDGIKETKTITAYSAEYTLSQKYISNFKVLDNTDQGALNDIVLYDPNDPNKSLLNIVLSKAYGWTVGHVDVELQNKIRSFDVERESVYDFLINEVSDKFNCIVEFDTINNTVSLFAEAYSELLSGDGTKNIFTLKRPLISIGSVTVRNSTDSTLGAFLTNDYVYDNEHGIIEFNFTPARGSTIEVTDGYQAKWDTDVFISFDNLSKEMTVNYSADNIKTVLTGRGADGLEFREVNMGLPYVIDLSYYFNEDWMGPDLYNMYNEYVNYVESQRNEDIIDRSELNELIMQKSELYNRLSTQYALANVNSTTSGTYYLRGGSFPNYTYTEVQLPGDYDSRLKYYKLNGVNLTEKKIDHFHSALWRAFLWAAGQPSIYHLPADEDDVIAFDDPILIEEFEFLDGRFISPYMISEYISDIFDNLEPDNEQIDVNFAHIDECTERFLAQVWQEYGVAQLTNLRDAKKTVQEVQLQGNFASYDFNTDTYCQYRANYIMLSTIEAALEQRQAEYDDCEAEIKNIQQSITERGQAIDIQTYFSTHSVISSITGEEISGEQLLPRLSAFMREDEYTNDSILVTDWHTDEQAFTLKEELRQNTLVELSKLCQPRLEFHMNMANIYALPEFEPIIDQFQLGNLVRVALRPDYIKRTRLLQVDIDFEDLTSLSCEFGDLTSVKSPSDIHADLLAKAIQAGKTVSSNKSYWDNGTNKSNEIDVKIQSGLLDAVTSIKSIDADQGIEIDKYGIHLRKENNGIYDDNQIWMTNNKIVFTDDNFKTAKTVLGEFEYGDRTFYGLLAEGVVGGLVAGSEIEGGTINIGPRVGANGEVEYNFSIDNNGTVTIRGGAGLAGTLDDVADAIAKEPIISSETPTNAIDGQLWIDTSTRPYTVKAYAESISENQMGDGVTFDFKLSNDFIDITSVTIKDTSAIDDTSDDASDNIVVITDYTYDIDTHIITLAQAPDDSSFIVVSGGAWHPVQAYDNNQNRVFVEKPDANTTGYNVNGMLYTAGDMWIIQPGDDKYPPNTVLVCTQDSKTYNPLHWQVAGNVDKLKEQMDTYNQVIKIFDDGLYLFGETVANEAPFYVRLTSGELSFYQRDAIPAPLTKEDLNGHRGKKVVWIGNHKLHAKQTDVEENLRVVSSNNQSSPSLGLYKYDESNPTNGSGVTWVLEANGSISLVKQDNVQIEVPTETEEN